MDYLNGIIRKKDLRIRELEFNPTPSNNNDNFLRQIKEL